MVGNNAGGNYNISCKINLSTNIRKGRKEERVEDKKPFTCEICSKIRDK